MSIRSPRSPTRSFSPSARSPPLHGRAGISSAMENPYSLHGGNSGSSHASGFHIDTGGVTGETDLSRVQLLLRVMEVEKRLARADDRVRMHEEATKLRLNELASSHALSADRASSFLNRLSEVELSAREAEIGVQSLDSKLGAEEEAMAALKQHVQAWRDEMKRELREELSKNINLRNATHHQELMSLMDKQAEQHAKIVRTHEVTSQGMHSKLQALEAKWNARNESFEQRLEKQNNEIQQLRERNHQLESRLQHVQHENQNDIQQMSQNLQQNFQQTVQAIQKEFQQAQQVVLQQAQGAVNNATAKLEETLAPMQQQLVLLTQLQEQQFNAHTTQIQTHYTQLQTHASQLTSLNSQLDYNSNFLQDKVSGLEHALNQLKAAQLAAQNSMLALSDNLTTSLTGLRDILPSKLDLERLESRMENSVTHTQATIEAMVSSNLAHVEQTIKSDVQENQSVIKEELQKERENVKQQLIPLAAEVNSLKGSVDNHSSVIEVQKKLSKRSAHSIQLIEEQLAAIQAKVLVTSENNATPFQMFVNSAGGTQTRFAPSSPLLSPPRHSTFTAHASLHSPLAMPNLSSQPALNLNLSDAAGLRVSPLRHTSSSAHRAASPSPVGVNGDSRLGRTNAISEEDFVASFLGQK